MLKNPNPEPTPQTDLRFPNNNEHNADGAYDVTDQFHGLGEDLHHMGPGSKTWPVVSPTDGTAPALVKDAGGSKQVR